MLAYARRHFFRPVSSRNGLKSIENQGKQSKTLGFPTVSLSARCCGPGGIAWMASQTLPATKFQRLLGEMPALGPPTCHENQWDFII